tara:strand:+ start:354 stop:791 length:438 start_codon:yes stop_codon:yes gene_type:complete
MILSHNFSLQNSELRYLKEKVTHLIEEKGKVDIRTDQRGYHELSWLKNIQRGLEMTVDEKALRWSRLAAQQGHPEILEKKMESMRKRDKVNNEDEYSLQTCEFLYLKEKVKSLIKEKREVDYKSDWAGYRELRRLQNIEQRLERS